MAEQDHELRGALQAWNRTTEAFKTARQKMEQAEVSLYALLRERGPTTLDDITYSTDGYSITMTTTMNGEWKEP